MGGTMSRFAALCAMFALLAAGCASVPPLPPQARQLVADGARSLEEGDLGTAEAQLMLATEWSPRFTEAWVNLGLVELRRGNLDMAHRHLRHARELNADSASPHHGLGLLFELRGDPAEAERNYRAALKVDPGFYPSRVNLGRLLYQRSAFDEARMEFSKLTLSAPDRLEAWCGLVEALLRLGRPLEADGVLRVALMRHGAAPGLMLLGARLALADGRFEDAVSLLSSLTTHADPEIAALALAWRGVVQLRKGERRRAEGDARAALLLAPRSEIATYVAQLATEGERTPLPRGGQSRP